MLVKSKDIHQTLKDIKEHLLEELKKSKKEEKRDWRTTEQRLTYRIKVAIRNLEPIIKEAIKNIHVHRERGNTPSLTIQQKVTLLLLKELFKNSNRSMASMLDVFSLLSGIDISYKTVERLYSDKEVEMALHNLHILLLKKKGVNKADACGDGTGYSLTIKKHYATETLKRKDKVKRTSKNKKKAFVYSFMIMDLKSRMYICYGVSLKSEKRAFTKAMKMLRDIDVTIDSIRLDRYYSFPSYVDKFGKAKVYIIPRKNATLKGSWKWKNLMIDFVKNTLPYLNEYYKRNQSESGFSEDKRRTGWKLGQRRYDRIDTAVFCKELWHNLFNLYS